MAETLAADQQHRRRRIADRGRGWKTLLCPAMEKILPGRTGHIQFRIAGRYRPLKTLWVKEGIQQKKQKGLPSAVEFARPQNGNLLNRIKQMRRQFTYSWCDYLFN